MNSRNYTVEEKYSVNQGDDWFAVYLASDFKRGDNVQFKQGETQRNGTVVDVQRGTFFGQFRYDYLVKYDGQSIPCWTHPKWLSKS